MYEHESGLPLAYDRATGKQELQGVVFHGERRFIQGAELNDLQTIQRERSARVGRLIASDGDRIERADGFVDVAAGTVTLTSGKIYVNGDVFPVEEAVLSSVPMVGRVEIGVRLTKSYVTHEDDPSLLGLVQGSLAEGEPGAAREVGSIAWALEGDEGEGQFYAVYVLQDGTILDQTGPSMLEPVMQQLAIYDRPNGNYIVTGNRVTALGANGGKQLFAIEEGEANINGFKRTRYAALRYEEEEVWEEGAIPGETHVYPGGASYTFSVDFAPIGVINSILLTKEKTVTVTRGAIAHGADALPDTSVIAILSVTQGATTFDAVTSWNRVNNSVDWAPGGPEPVSGSTYTVTYRYRDAVAPTSATDSEITVANGATGGDIIVSYTQKLPRIDRIGLRQDGAPIYIKGIPARSNPKEPTVPADVLALCQVINNWMSTPIVINDGVRSLPYAEMWRYFNRIIDIDRLVQLERLKSGIDAKEPVAKKGMFVDPFIDDTYRDQGQMQSGAIGNGMLQLSITPTFYMAPLADPVMLDWTEEVIVSQELKTACEKINPYANFIPLPGTMKLSPAADFWTESRTDWTSAQTLEFNRGTRTDGGPLQTSTTETQLVDQRSELLQFLRQIEVDFTISGFGAGEILETLTFDGIDVKPAGTQTADANGVIAGTFTIPENVTAGSKVVRAIGEGETEATAMFTGQGTIAIDVMRRVTTINNWTAPRVERFVEQWGNNNNQSDGVGGNSDPQAQMFAVPEMRQVVGVDFHICHVGDEGNHLLVDQVSISNGYPTLEIFAEALVPMAGVAAGTWLEARYTLPVTSAPDRRHAFVIKTDDSDHSVSLAALGGFDADQQKRVTSHPYVTGPRFSSVNAETWTAHQDEALAFRIVAARYPVTTKTVDLGTYDLVDCSDLQVRAAVELPGAGCSVVFEVERPNGTIYRLLPFQILQLTEYLTETVELRAVLTGTSKLSPILYAPVELVAGEISTGLTYITRAFSLGTAVRIAAYYKAYLPGGATVTMDYSIDDGPWVTLPLDETEALAFPLWVERKHEETGLTGTTARLRITGTGGPAARLIVGDLGAGIF
ncbi:conserved protein of unknown function [Pseudorhizobium banfieldiae]|uniref:DUF4815 domain-containing protein n=1 Tax=Pseudorhizobium banfieldiae TaxID=1125847 RepID=L0NDP7_9HYPH|nr:DUF4815 domain-containing protein [Pseudorhizobium banfieldiae]CAD6606260.1 hypothetical protein RNT25_01825 [arsenite-oxidising bacterium NT-25]CCF19170.1 conserved protein of unknown function [Pseudorhizobium banfieldiae]